MTPSGQCHILVEKILEKHRDREHIDADQQAAWLGINFRLLRLLEKEWSPDPRLPDFRSKVDALADRFHSKQLKCDAQRLAGALTAGFVEAARASQRNRKRGVVTDAVEPTVRVLQVPQGRRDSEPAPLKGPMGRRARKRFLRLAR